MKNTSIHIKNLANVRFAFFFFKNVKYAFDLGHRFEFFDPPIIMSDIFFFS